MIYRYELVVEGNDEAGYTAQIDGPDSPLSGYGPSPILALKELVATLADWPNGGSNRWLDTPAGTRLARMFVPTYEPKPSVPES